MLSDTVLTQFQPSGVRVTLLLSGGHQYTLLLSRDAELLKDLMSVVVDRAQAQNQSAPRLFQIPVESGYASLCIASSDIVGVITQPPLLLQATQPEASLAALQPPPSAPVPASVPAPAPALSTEVLPSSYFQLHSFLTPEEHTQLLRYATKRELGFVPTQTSTGAEDYRKSSILYDFPEFSQLMRQRIQNHLPAVLDKLDLLQFQPSLADIEVQLTAHGDGNYYRVHNDNGSPDTAARILTYVYYFYQDPKPFTGGELRIYDSRIENGFYVQAESFQTVEPVNNSIVFFLSRYLHEVLPICCPSREFADSRFTVNGWIRQDG